MKIYRHGQKVRQKFLGVKHIISRREPIRAAPIRGNEPSTASQKLHGEREQFPFLPEPTWSISSLLPDKSPSDESISISPEKLRHLLRLSALPEPESPEEEKQMLSDLSEQLHFVRHMQKVCVDGVEPLQAIRDETEQGEKETEITIGKLKRALAQEEFVGKHYPRLRRKTHGVVNGISIHDEITPKHWDPLAHAERTVGRFFVVDRRKQDKIE